MGLKASELMQSFLMYLEASGVEAGGGGDGKSSQVFEQSVLFRDVAGIPVSMLLTGPLVFLSPRRPFGSVGTFGGWGGGAGSAFIHTQL